MINVNPLSALGTSATTQSIQASTPATKGSCTNPGFGRATSPHSASDLTVSNSASCLLLLQQRRKRPNIGPAALARSKSCNALNEPYVPFDFFFVPFFFAITLLLGFDELDPAGIEFKAPSPDHRKTMVHCK